MTDYSGKTIGQYQLVTIIDQTGQALVYKGFQPSMNRYVAVKVLKPGAARDQTTIQQFNQFAELATRLQHPGLMPVNDSGQEEGVFYRVMPFMEGGSLADNLPAYRDPNRAFGLMQQIVAALDYIHGQGFIHGNLKPENILFDESQRPVLSNYGFARQFNEAPNPFMSPEQLQGGVVDKRADTYALGVLLYTILAGQMPPPGVVVSLRAVRPDLSQELEMLILKALAQNPDQRYQTASEFSTALETALRAPLPPPQPLQAPAPTSYTSPPQPVAKKGPNWLAIILGGGLIVVMCLCAYLVGPQVIEYFSSPTAVAEVPPPVPTEPQPGVTVVVPTRDPRPTRPPVEIPTQPPAEPTQPPEQPPEQLPELPEQQPPVDGGSGLPDICGSVGLIGGSAIFGSAMVSRRRIKRSHHS